MRKSWIVLPALLVAGCGWSGFQRGVSVKPSEVHAFAGVCSAPVADLSPVGYTVAGFDFVDEQCGIFFDGIIELTKNSRFASASIATANTQAAAIMAAVDVASKTIGIVAASSELARKLIDGYAAEYAFAPYALETRQLVLEAMTAYRNDTSATVATLPTRTDASGDDYCMAHNIVRNYAKICTVANVEALARQAVANSKIKKADSSSSGSGRTSRGAGGAAPSGLGAEVARSRGATSEQIRIFRRGLGLPNYTAGRP